jgi:DUF1707 SHOCT-like domain
MGYSWRRPAQRPGQNGSRPMKPSSLVWVSAPAGTSTRAPYWPEERRYAWPVSCEGVPVMTGPEDPAAAARDRLRAGYADREQVIETLKDAFVQGRLTRDELDVRAGRALAARTRAELAALTADIPGDPAADGAAPPPDPGPRAQAAGLGGRRVGHMPGHRGRRRTGRFSRRFRRTRPQSLSVLGSLVPYPGLSRRAHGTRHLHQRGGHRSGAEALSQVRQPTRAAPLARTAALPW